MKKPDGSPASPCLGIQNQKSTNLSSLSFRNLLNKLHTCKVRQNMKEKINLKKSLKVTDWDFISSSQNPQKIQNLPSHISPSFHTKSKISYASLPLSIFLYLLTPPPSLMAEIMKARKNLNTIIFSLNFLENHLWPEVSNPHHFRNRGVTQT